MPCSSPASHSYSQWAARVTLTRTPQDGRAGGVSGSGNTSGTAGTGGNAGAAGNAGTGGDAGTAGSSGQGGNSGTGPGLAVDLGASGNFVILAKSAISTVPTSAVTGNVGLSPAAATFITGFSLTADPTQCVCLLTTSQRQALRRRLHATNALQLDHRGGRHGARVHRRRRARAGRHGAGCRKHRWDDPVPRRLQVGDRSVDPDGRHPRGQRNGRLDLPDRAGSHGRPARRRST